MDIDTLITDIRFSSDLVDFVTVTVEDGELYVGWEAGALEDSEAIAEAVWGGIEAAMERHGLDFWATLRKSGGNGGGQPNGAWGEWATFTAA